MLDNFDREILRIVQANNLITHTKIGEKVGLSTSAVRRRLSILRENGTIIKDVALVKRDNLDVTVIISVSFKEDTVEGYDAFDKQMASLPNVKQSYHVSGSTDYVLIVHGPSLTWYEDWAKTHLMSNPAILRHDTSVIWSCKKFETSISI